MQFLNSNPHVTFHPSWLFAAGVIGIGLATSACSTSSDAAPVITDAGHDAANVDTLSGLPETLSFTTLYKSPLVIEGLTADSAGNLYAAARAGTPCPVWRVAAATGEASVVGNITAPCSPSGLTFDSTGDLFIADGDKIYRITPDDQAPPTASVFASGVPGANGVAFDRHGTLWVSDGGTGQGRVWSITSDGSVSEAFRVQPLANDVNAVENADGGAGAELGGVGRDPRALPPGSLNITPAARTPGNAVGSVAIVANGVAFAPDGSLFVADTGRGALWKATFDAQGSLTSPVGCDTTFSPNTLCLKDVFLAHPMLEGLDGIALDAAGNIWGVASERNAVLVVTPQAGIREVFRNPPDSTSKLRNTGPLEFPTSPFLVDRKMCITQSDVSRRDNFPNSAGEVGPGVVGPLLAKISCSDQALPQTGLTLPVH